MYRPTVRYNDRFKEYVEEMFKSTHLDRTQIIRAALFIAAHTEEFKQLISRYKKKDVPLPSSPWWPTDHHLWLELDGLGEQEREGEGKHDDYSGERTVSQSSKIHRTSTDGSLLRGTTLQKSEKQKERRHLGSIEGCSGKVHEKRVIKHAGHGITIRLG